MLHPPHRELKCATNAKNKFGKAITTFAMYFRSMAGFEFQSISIVTIGCTD